ncbi:hypothetical protein D6D19_07993 [Aureobasidium pullulans]|uniref:Rhodopsin domain-containing protein n=1 Tax=Aureobasidium pullulans TaxID=5580 RepID=A0A4S8ZUS5_AURPU|nr:hypothetical protein D6D19_07993 [Aureobasidium pullulans]
MAANLTTVNGAPLPPGTYYFSRITDTDHAGYVWIVALLSLIYPFGTLLVRLNVRWGLYGADDWALVAATLAAVCQHIPIFVGLKAGFGKSSKVLEQGQIASIDDSIYAAEVLFIFAYTLSKITRWRAVTTFDIITEAALMIVPSYLVSGVMLGSRPKMLVMTAFAFRLAVVGFSITHLRRLSRTVDAEDKGFSFISPGIWIQIWLAWSLVSASIPSFRAFMNPFDNISVAKTDDSHSASRSELNGAYLMMGSISKPSHRNHGASARSASQGMSLSSKLGTRTSVHHESRDRGVDEARSMESWHSRSGIIRKEVEWEIRHDHEPL